MSQRGLSDPKIVPLISLFHSVRLARLSAACVLGERGDAGHHARPALAGEVHAPGQQVAVHHARAS